MAFTPQTINDWVDDDVANDYPSWNAKIAKINTNFTNVQTDLNAASNAITALDNINDSIKGYEVSYNANGQEIEVALGVAWDSTGNYILENTAGTIDFSGAGELGLDTGAAANDTFYHVWAVGKSRAAVGRVIANTSVTFVLSTSTVAATVASNLNTTLGGSPGYDKARRLGSIRTDGSANRYKFIQQAIGFVRRTTFTGVNHFASPFEVNDATGAVDTTVDCSGIVPATAKAFTVELACYATGVSKSGSVNIALHGQTASATNRFLQIESATDAGGNVYFRETVSKILPIDPGEAGINFHYITSNTDVSLRANITEYDDDVSL